MVDHPVAAAMRTLPEGRLRVGFSGGMDSTVLLHAAARTLEKAGEKQRLTAHHLNHSLILEAGDMASHCRNVAREFGVSFECDDIEVLQQGNMEAGARRARYARWGEVLAPGETLLLAHHADDQAETLLMRLMRGAPVELLRAMPVRRAHAKGRLLRPLLHMPRECLKEYAEAHGLKWFEDPSNQDTARDRNFIRHKVLPVLAHRWPDAVRSIVRATESLHAEFVAYDALIARSAKKIRVDEFSLSIKQLIALPEVVRATVLRRSLESIGIHAISQPHLQEMLTRFAGDHSGDFLLGSDKRLTQFGDKLVLRSSSKVGIESCYAWQLGDALCLPHGELRAKTNAAARRACIGQDLEQLEIRFRMGGERLRVNGMGKKVSRLFQEAAVPPWQRAHWPLLYVEDELVSVAGIAVDDAFVKDEGWLIEWSPC